MIRIKRSDAESPNPTAWPVGFEAEWTEDDSAAPIFVMQAAGGGLSTASFSCVASEIQMRDLPVDELADSGPFFRVASFSSIFRTLDAVSEFQTTLLGAVLELVNERTAAAVLAETDEFIITPDV